MTFQPGVDDEDDSREKVETRQDGGKPVLTLND